MKTDPMEAMIREALKKRGIEYLEGDDNNAHLDFFLIGIDIYVEVKQFHSDRIAEQMSRVENVIVAQGRDAVKWLSELISSNAAVPSGNEAQVKQPSTGEPVVKLPETSVGLGTTRSNLSHRTIKDDLLDAALARCEQLRTALQVADESIRHHLRGDQISAALIQPHAVKAIRDALVAQTTGVGDG